MTAESAPSLRGSAANGLAPGPEEARQRRLEGQGTGLSLSRWWPERVTQGQPRLLLAALAVGLLAAILLPGNAIGLGLLVVLTAGGAALWLASPRRGSRWSWFTAALALPLGGLMTPEPAAHIARAAASRPPPISVAITAVDQTDQEEP